MVWTILLLLSGCNIDWGFGGEETGDEINGGTGPLTSEDGVDTASWASFDAAGGTNNASTCDSGDTGSDAPTSLHATGGAGVIEVVHDGVDGDCCGTTWSFGPQWAGPGMIDVSYHQAAEPACGCACDWSLPYTIEGVTAGTWTVRALGDTATVTVQ